MASIDSKNFIAIALKSKKRDEFHGLDSSSLAKYLKDDALLVENEKEAFDVLRNWVMHKPKERFAEVPKLLPLIRLNQLEPAFLKTKVKDFAVEGNCAQLIKWAIKRQNRPLHERDELTVDFCTNPRKSATEVEMFALCTKGKRLQKITSMKKFSTKTNKWTNVPIRGNIAAFDLKLGSCMHGKHNLIVQDKESLRSYSLNLVTLNAVPLPPKVLCCEEYTLQSLDDKLYLVGFYMEGVGPGEPYLLSGFDSGNSLVSAVQCFDFETWKWTALKSMIQPRIGYCSAVLNGKIYVAGGFPSATVECYDPKTNEWTPAAPMCRSRANAEMVAHNGYLYVFGGRGCNFFEFHLDAFQEIERYDPIENEWIIIPDKLNETMYGFSVIHVHDRVYFIGGNDFGKNPITGMNKLHVPSTGTKPNAIFDLSTEKFLVDKIPVMPDNFYWPIVGFYINE